MNFVRGLREAGERGGVVERGVVCGGFRVSRYGDCFGDAMTEGGFGGSVGGGVEG